MMDRVLPGGVAPDIAPGGAAAILAALDAVAAEIPALLRIYDSHASLQDRVVGTGFLDPARTPRATRRAASSGAGRAGASMRGWHRATHPTTRWRRPSRSRPAAMWMRACVCAWRNCAKPSRWCAACC
jgi:Ni,Fe-hydrogenase III large subunit